MSLEPSDAPTLIQLPVQAPKTPPSTSALIERLVAGFGAQWVDAASVDAWAAAGGDRVVLLAGDPVQFPEGLDVAVVLPELQRSLPGRFAVGQSVSRKEDPVLLRGEGRYTDDLNLPGQAYAVIVRSRVAHGILKSVAIDDALATAR